MIEDNIYVIYHSDDVTVYYAQVVDSGYTPVYTTWGGISTVTSLLTYEPWFIQSIPRIYHPQSWSLEVCCFDKLPLTSGGIYTVRGIDL